MKIKLITLGLHFNQVKIKKLQSQAISRQIDMHMN